MIWEGAGFSETVLRVDGGMVASDWLMQRLADMLATPVDRPKLRETTAMGAAYLAGLATGVYPEPDVFAEGWGAGTGASSRAWQRRSVSGSMVAGRMPCAAP